ncbi:GNAT family N-acetyltransferase [Photobacterium japonica]|uniref:GNAT family N-acetyltransferase n=1 Tax=Photobacterium japonica TaxID=2910235 RepID=UPI003D145025
MTPLHSPHDQFWAKRLNTPLTVGLHFSVLDYWDMGDPDTVGFLYSSPDLTILDLAPDLLPLLQQTVASMPNARLQCFNQAISLNPALASYEVDCNDGDYFRQNCPPLTAPNVPSGYRIEVTTERPALLDAFLEQQPEADQLSAGLDDEFDRYYSVYRDQALVACLGTFQGRSSYFVSLAMLVDQHERRQGLAKYVLQQAVHEIEANNGTLCYRVNVDNAASIAVCRSLGFSLTNQVQTLSIKHSE